MKRLIAESAKLISKDEISQAINLLLEKIPYDMEEETKEIISLSRRHRAVHKLIDSRTISHENSVIELNKISESLTGFVFSIRSINIALDWSDDDKEEEAILSRKMKAGMEERIRINKELRESGSEYVVKPAKPDKSARDMFI